MLTVTISNKNIPSMNTVKTHPKKQRQFSPNICVLKCSQIPTPITLKPNECLGWLRVQVSPSLHRRPLLHGWLLQALGQDVENGRHYSVSSPTYPEWQMESLERQHFCFDHISTVRGWMENIWIKTWRFATATTRWPDGKPRLLRHSITVWAWLTTT